MPEPSSLPRGLRGLRSLTQNGTNSGACGYSSKGIHSQRVRRIVQTYDSAKQMIGTE